jgi:hypothetical protein
VKENCNGLYPAFIAVKLIYIPLTACVNASKEIREEQSGFKIRDLCTGMLAFG